MPKNIIVCADGTWNGPAVAGGPEPIDGNDDRGEFTAPPVTNVVKVFGNLMGYSIPATIGLADEQEISYSSAAGEVLQVAKYLHGVGDSSNILYKILGGAFGMGIIARIVRGYTFISRHYKPGDSIHIIGFSRGAYTARALAGMIARVGLLNPATYDINDKEAAYRLGIAAWAKSKSVSISPLNILSNISNTFVNFIQEFVATGLSAASLIPNVPIKTVAVWDTVGAMGVPAYMQGQRYDLFRFVDDQLSPLVENGFHAMAIDELRIDFPVTQWAKRNGVVQCWFVGAHADVGGGYAADQSQLSDLALDWMIKQLKSVGVLFVNPLHPTAPSVLGVPVHTPWTKPPFSVLEQSARKVDTGDFIHASVLARWSTENAYRPLSMQGFRNKPPGDFHILE
ncbi:DUF2235 domain-containing protein [Undibacterium terreum]|uniref:T6SS Phospholipase effector Tle1-like catalytic domain-containing protein n=1 Tax=Undibacterium terreum TaxID=1224302 RepID=A0A916U7H1_9BURK|nr:DUF2235 domain-containing protein [Undibacterium terreum]GGC62580.1 hypothetical protein GCM10011396_06920 [Undibacterium terreum]